MKDLRVILKRKHLLILNFKKNTASYSWYSEAIHERFFDDDDNDNNNNNNLKNKALYDSVFMATTHYHRTLF